MLAKRSLKLAAIGTAAGLFSGLFGVGGGTVTVPLLMLWLGYSERAATGTSLAAIVFIAGFGAATQGAYGNLRVLDGLLIGIPAIGLVLSVCAAGFTTSLAPITSATSVLGKSPLISSISTSAE